MTDIENARERVDRYLAAFNAIEAELRRRLGERRSVGFRELSRSFERSHRWWAPQHDLMDPIADLRNFLVHRHVEPNLYAAIPTLAVLELVESVRDKLLAPRTVFDAFRGDVVSVTPSTKLSEVLGTIAERSITHFPIRDGDRFVGLLTTNGIANWLAKVGLEIALVDLDVDVRSVFEAEEENDDVAFVPRSMPVEEAFDLFAGNAKLKALLITHGGERDHAPLGIVTASDVAGWVEA
jgi:predicted transcriptional regulator